jgi:DDE superfamily endonuclease
MTVQPHPPELLAAWLRPFLADLTRPTWRNALILIAGAVLAPGRRTVAATLRVTGLGQAPTFTNYHRVLNRNRWSGLYRSTIMRHRFAFMRPWAPGRADRLGPGPVSCSRAAR